MGLKTSYLFKRIWGIPVLAVAVFVVGLLTTATIYSIVLENTEALARSRFEAYKSLLVARITHRLDGYAQVLHGAAGLFNASDVVTAEEWKHYVKSLRLDQYYPGLDSLGYFSVPGSKEARAEKYATLVYDEPTHLLSEKMFKPTADSQAIRQEAMEAARDQNNVAVTKKLVLVQEASGEKQLGFLMLFPVYQKGAKLDTLEARRTALQGYVFSTFRSKDFLKEVTDLFDDYLEVNVYDGPNPSEKDLIYKSISHKEAAKMYANFQTGNQLLVGGHVWSVAAKAKENPDNSFAPDNLDGIIAFGIILSILISVMMWMLISTRIRAERTEKVDSTIDVKPIKNELPQYFSKIFHELKTPLNSILVLSKVFVDNKEHNLNEKQIEQAGVIHQSGAELLEMIDEVMDLSKISSGKMLVRYDKIVIRDLAEEIKISFSALAEHKSLAFNVTVDAAVPHEMYNDYRKIYQIIKNLCSNAIKFTKAGTVTVHFYLPDLIDAIAISVTDTGRGIAREHLENVFEPFYQESAETETMFGGSGLGLTISQEMAHVLGGEIVLSSQEMKGSSFTVYLPMNSTMKAH